MFWLDVLIVKGDVVVLPFSFTDLTASKKRPALVVAPTQTYNDVILCMITSKAAVG
ncbi:MAG: type II toxin-antitoxin system PemK/MazF family toxin [Anaerolineales bacterium]|nr:type II toxin-antitoxin system PemK/MazF family toxin [Anaerolineales bacterium]